MNRPKLVAIVTGVISVIICIIYLLFISVFDFRTILNNYLINRSENMAVIFYLMLAYHLI